MVPAATQSQRALANQTDGATRWFVIWMLFVAYCQGAGWTLSALHQLNATGYALAFVPFFAAVGLWLRKNPNTNASPLAAKLKHRLSRPFPFSFLVLAALAFLGGALCPPNNFDGLVYRTPRVLHWMAENRWHWIHTHFGTLNSRTAGFEWITAPLFAFFKTDRIEFLINATCFLFLPGRVFATLTRFGVCARAGYYWMWIYPTAYGFLLQAGSIGNDMFCALWPIAAFEFALRARHNTRIEWVWFSILAAALMTSSKAFNILLLPAWGIAVLPTLQLLLQRPLASIGVAIFAAIVSLIPTALLNIHYCGDWTGLTVEPVLLDNGPPPFNLAVNSILLLVQNFAPPIFPFSTAWDRFVAQIIPTATAARLDHFFEPDAARFRIPELQAEESAGLGFGVCVLLFLILLRQFSMRSRTSVKNFFSHRNLIALAALAGAAIYMAKSGLYAPARYLLPLYFPILVPIIALPAAASLTRKPWWRAAALATFGIAAAILIISPARPLWPAETVLRNINQKSSPLLQRAALVYSLYRDRADLLRPIRETLPTNARTVGLISLTIPETSLWRPFGSRRVLHIRREDSPEFLRARGIDYVVIGPNIMGQVFKSTPQEWARRNNGDIIQQFRIQTVARGAPTDWVLIHLL